MVAVDDEDGAGAGEGSAVPGTPMDVGDNRARSPSVGSVQVGGGKKGKGKKSAGLSEILEPDGGLPGAKDGLGAFPPGSDWADLMLALKLKGVLHIVTSRDAQLQNVRDRQTLSH